MYESNFVVYIYIILLRPGSMDVNLLVQVSMWCVILQIMGKDGINTVSYRQNCAHDTRKQKYVPHEKFYKEPTVWHSSSDWDKHGLVLLINL